MRRTTTKANSTISAPRSSSLPIAAPASSTCAAPRQTPSSVSRATAPTSDPNQSMRRGDTSGLILGCGVSAVHRTYGPFTPLTRDPAAENGQKDLCTLRPSRRTLQRSLRADGRVHGLATRCSPVERGKVSVKRQTLILVVIGVILFIAGSAIAFASVKGASKKTGSGVNVAPVTTSVVVAKANIPAGTTGQSMVSNNLVAIEPIPTKSYTPTDLGSLQGLSSEVLTAAVKKGHALSATELTASSSAISRAERHGRGDRDADRERMHWPAISSPAHVSTSTPTSPRSRPIAG